MKRILVIISILILAMGMMACKKAPAVDGAGQTTAGKEASSWKEQYDLGLRLLNEGEIKAFKNGRVWRIPKSAVVEYTNKSAKLFG